jgi:hypothetical protein
MNTMGIKKSFHNLIDSIDIENILILFYKMKKSKLFLKKGQIWNRLTLEQKEELMLSLKESENSENLISYEEMKNKYKKWL